MKRIELKSLQIVPRWCGDDNCLVFGYSQKRFSCWFCRCWSLGSWLILWSLALHWEYQTVLAPLGPFLQPSLSINFLKALRLVDAYPRWALMNLWDWGPICWSQPIRFRHAVYSDFYVKAAKPSYDWLLFPAPPDCRLVSVAVLLQSWLSSLLSPLQ